MKAKRKLTLPMVRSILRPSQIGIRIVDGEFNVVPRFHGAGSANVYVTDDLTDALHRGLALAEQRRELLGLR